MNIQQFRYILALEKYRSFGQAAEHCFITQSTLSTMVARFESEIGLKLFDRSTKPISITREGEQVIQQIKRVLAEITSLEHLTEELSGESGGRIRIGVIPTIGPYLIPHFLNNFIKKFPGIHFDVSETITDKILHQVELRELDIGIVSIPLNAPNTIEIPLYEEPFLFYDVTRTDWSKDFSVSELDLHRLWLLQEGHCMLHQVEQICDMRSQKRVQNRNLDYKSGTIDSLLKLVRNNNGVTLLPYLSTINFSEAENQHLRSFEEPVPVRSVGLLVHKHFAKNRLLKELEHDIKENVVPLLQNFKGSKKVLNPV